MRRHKPGKAVLAKIPLRVFGRHCSNLKRQVALNCHPRGQLTSNDLMRTVSSCIKLIQVVSNKWVDVKTVHNLAPPNLVEGQTHMRSAIERATFQTSDTLKSTMAATKSCCIWFPGWRNQKKRKKKKHPAKVQMISVKFRFP